MITLNGYYPEMGQAAPVDAVIEARLSHYGRHYFLSTRLTLAVGRGVEFLGTLTAANLVAGSAKVGMNEYKVTVSAMEKISKQHKVSSVSLL